LVALAFAIAFAVTTALRLETCAIVALAIFTPVVIFYASSFLRGASDE
jgi:hypothetical protein